MTDKIMPPSRPHGLERWLFRLPVGLYQAGLGNLLGDRFLFLTHIGRKTGAMHQTVVEIVGHDCCPDSYYVVSGWGEKSNWYQNVMAHPRVKIQVGNRSWDATAERVSPERGAQIMLSYYHRHPAALWVLSRLMGYPFDGTEKNVRTFGESIPILVFRSER